MKAVLLRFLILLFLLLGLTSVATYYFYSEDVKQLHHQIQDRERSRHLSNLHITRLHFSPIIDDLNYLTEKAKETLLSTPSQFEQQMVASFIRMSRTRGYYDQIRLIDSKGQEIIRVDRNEGKSTLVAKSQLQNKSHRNYIQSALKIPLDSIFTSQFDLNTEHGKIEHPYKPTLRFISHFKVGEKRWLLSFNYLGEDYLSELKRQFGSTDVQNWLINNHGQWLLGPNGQEWLFMADPERRPSDDFLTQYPTLWQQILSHPKGQYVQDGFLYTYTRFFSGSSFSGHNHFTLPFKGTDLPWTIISRVNLDQAVANLAYSPSRVIKFIVLGILLVSLLSGCMALSWHLFQLLSAQRILSQANEDSAKKYRTVLKHAPDGLLTINEKGEIITINQAAKTILNITNQDTEGRILIKQLSGIQARKEVRNLIKDIKGKNYKSGPLKTRIQLKNLKTKHIEIIATQTLYSNSTEILLNLRDITYWIEREEKLKSMSRALEQSNDAIIITDYKGIIEYVNPSFEKNNKVKHKDVVGTQSINLLRQALLSNNEVFEVQQQLKSGQTIERIITHRDKGDDIIYEEKTIAPIRNNRGKISHYISTGKDITERVLFENKIHRLAHYDILTELPNRMLFQQDLERAIAQAGLTKSVSLMILNLDQFKHVNDSYDHEVGDKVIQSIAKRLKHTLREGDILARLGGDEFAILVSQNLSPTEIAQMASRIISHISSPLAIDSLELFLTASIGISIYPQDSTNPEEINKYADIALHRAKELGRNQFCFYTSQMRVESTRLHQLESELRKSLGTDQYALYYQPKVNSRSHKICGVEALYAGIILREKSNRR
ncbi:diguanylate cyclase domain-containing protein [Photobacterium aquae]|uniref:diguanylate cyclase domain-containing protein n=1 Tax=Photobacterium aquae TaxID=1195763 RepID=UPI000AEAAF5D|nr:diguanylate cyclase [Photobacterium aquae]